MAEETPQGQRVYVKAPLFSGWGRISNHFPSEPYFPIEVTLENGDSDGHRIKRVSFDEIIKREGGD